MEHMDFHPNSELFFTAGRDKTLRLFQIDGIENPKVASYHFENFPITGAVFDPKGDNIFLSGLSHKMWRYDTKPFHFYILNVFFRHLLHYFTKEIQNVSGRNYVSEVCQCTL